MGFMDVIKELGRLNLKASYITGPPQVATEILNWLVRLGINVGDNFVGEYITTTPATAVAQKALVRELVGLGYLGIGELAGVKSVEGELNTLQLATMANLGAIEKDILDGFTTGVEKLSLSGKFIERITNGVKSMQIEELAGGAETPRPEKAGIGLAGGVA